MHAPIAHDRYDVVIAGARVAGASTAMLLARAGARVLVVDPVPRGRDTLSTHALMRGAVLQLHRWGLLDAIREAGTPDLPVTTFDYGDEVISIPIKPRDGVDALFAPRRTVLDPILGRAAEDAGAEVVHGVSLADLRRDEQGRVVGARLIGRDGEPVEVDADLVVGADGIRSRVARLVAAPIEHRGRNATASLFGYWQGIDPSEYRWAFRPGAGAGIIPTNDGDACIFASVSPALLAAAGREGMTDLFMDTMRAVDPVLAERLTPDAMKGRLRAFPGEFGFLKRSRGPGWALVGDAGYFRDPITAHGITDALRDAETLARAVAVGSEEALDAYQATRDAVARELLDVTDEIASMVWTMEEVKTLHLRLSKAMNAGIEVIEGWAQGRNGGPARAA
jgi:2-polyprenyl-6-methoxyphenol hydroxylase-like FAD-dependent oxidoreductase